MQIRARLQLSATTEEWTVRFASATLLSRENGDWKILATNIAHLDE